MKKLYLSILYVVFISVLISGTILFSKPQTKNNKSTYYIKTNQTDPGMRKVSSDKKGIEEYEVDIKNRQEDIKVINNNSNIDLHAKLSENKYGLVTLNISYKVKGKPVNKSIDATHLKELRNMFGLREKYKSGFVIKNVLINEKYKKIYFSVEGKSENGFFRTSLYTYDLEESKLERLFYEVGKFSNFYINPDEQYSACSYLSCPLNISGNTKNTVIIFSCKDDRQLFNSSIDLKMDNSSMRDLYVYSCEFVKWLNSNTCEINQELWAKDGAEKPVKKTLIYNVASKKIIE